MQFFPSSGRIDTAAWMYYMDANKSYGEKAWRQLHKNAASNKEQLLEAASNKAPVYGYRPPITKTIQVRRKKHAGHCRRSKAELISDEFLSTPSHRRTKTGRPARTYIKQLCADSYAALKTYQNGCTIEKSYGRVLWGSALVAWYDDDVIYAHTRTHTHTHTYIYIYIK